MIGFWIGLMWNLAMDLLVNVNVFE